MLFGIIQITVKKNFVYMENILPPNILRQGVKIIRIKYNGFQEVFETTYFFVLRDVPFIFAFHFDRFCCFLCSVP